MQNARGGTLGMKLNWKISTAFNPLVKFDAEIQAKLTQGDFLLESEALHLPLTIICFTDL